MNANEARLMKVLARLELAALGFAIAAGGLFLGLLNPIQSYRAYWHDQAFMRTSLLAVAHVASADSDPDRRGQYGVRYTFQAPSGQTFEGWSSDGAPHRMGSALKIRYSPADPQESYPVAHVPDADPPDLSDLVADDFGPAVIGLIIAIGGLAIGFPGLRAWFGRHLNRPVA